MHAFKRGGDRFSAADAPRASAAVILAFTIAAFYLSPAVSQTAAQQMTSPQQQQNMLLSGHIRYSRISPPSAGVKLLDDIFMKVRSAPQLAMAKNLNNLTQQSQELQQGATNYKLAIRPRQMGKTLLDKSPTLQLVPNEQTLSQLPADSLNSLPAAFGGAGAGGAGVGGTAMVANAPASPQIWQGNKQLPLIANGLVPRGQSGFWESGSNSNSVAAPRYMAPSAANDSYDAPARAEKSESAREASSAGKRQYEWKAAEKPPALGVALGRLANVTRAIDSAQKLAQAPVPMAAPQSQLRDRGVAEETAYRTSDKKTLNQTDLEAYPFASKLQAKAASAAETDGLMKLKAKQKKAVASKERRQAQEYGDEIDAASEQRAAKDTRAKIAMGADIALLPPNVVTGIPLVRLGISQNQAHAALAAMGSMKQDKVSKWTVWSWQRPLSKIATALQLYIRSNTGLLDAMRIFDPSLIAPDFGVSMGDNLARVKEKFGEPAFILQEPTPGAGQNYIYPISQVGFQLARPSPDEQPRVVSILIFNVK